MFWERHLRRLMQSVEILAERRPDMYPLKCRFESSWDVFIRPLVHSSLKSGMELALKNMKHGEELAVTSIVHGTIEQPDDDSVASPCDVYMHIGGYWPMKFGLSDSAAYLALVGQSREIAMSKFSEWARTRKYLEKLRPPSVTELLLSNDGDHILEGTVTNFFVVCQRDMNRRSDEAATNPNNMHLYEVQTAPLNDGVLPGVIRQIVMEICSSMGIPFCEVAPSWSKHGIWAEAFVTNSLRLVQHVKRIQVPSSWEDLQSKSWEEVSWEVKNFKDDGFITTLIQSELMKRVSSEGYSVRELQRYCFPRS
ncbi:unnamed protein product [Victoria cruziana]